MKRLTKFCCCATTRTGTIVSGALGIVAAIFTIILVWVTPRNTISYSTIIFDENSFGRDVPRIIITINLCFTVLICALLIVAVLKRRSWLMLPWVVLGIVLAVGLLISILHTCISLYLDDEDYVIMSTCILILGLLYLCFYLYLWAVVFSHYLDVRDEEERGRYRKQPYRR